MQLTPETITILQNYASINQHLILAPGSELRTIHPSKATFSTATISETVEKDAAIFDLPKFLRTVGLVNNPTIEFGDKQFTFSDDKGKTKIQYSYADATSMLKVPRGVQSSLSAAKIRISAENLRAIVTASKSLKLPGLKLWGNTNGECFAELLDPTGGNKDTYTIDLSDDVETIDEDFSKTLKTEYINFVQGNYVAEVSDIMVKFDGGNIRYWVAVESEKK